MMKDGKYLFMMLILLIFGITASAQNKKSDREMFKEGYVLQTKDIHFAPPSEKLSTRRQEKWGHLYGSQI